jgi:hypothetical protein
MRNADQTPSTRVRAPWRTRYGEEHATWALAVRGERQIKAKKMGGRMAARRIDGISRTRAVTPAS